MENEPLKRQELEMGLIMKEESRKYTECDSAGLTDSAHQWPRNLAPSPLAAGPNGTNLQRAIKRSETVNYRKNKIL